MGTADQSTRDTRMLPVLPMHDSITGNSYIPFQKRTPPSLYNAVRNSASFERTITYEEIKRRIEGLEKVVPQCYTEKVQNMAESFEPLLKFTAETEAKGYGYVWFGIVEVIEKFLMQLSSSMDNEHLIFVTEGELNAIQEEVDQILTQLKTETLKEVQTASHLRLHTTTLNRQYRSLLHKFPHKMTNSALELLWKTNCKLLDHFLNSQKSLVISYVRFNKPMKISKNKPKLRVHGYQLMLKR